MASERLEPGHLLKNRFKIIDTVGEGAFGVVYRAEDLEVQGGQWAVKEIWEGSLSEEEKNEALLLFEREARLLRSLNHTSIPKVIDYFSTGDRHYLIMEYVEGETLQEKIRLRKPDIRETLAWGIKICDVLENLHSLDPPVIFRDIKPSNIIITPKGRLMLIDFGIARHFNPAKVRDTFMLGTPGFCSPEQYGKGQTDSRSDIYSLGALIYHLLTGEDLAQFAFKIPPISRLDLSIPRKLEELLDKCLRQDPDCRYQNIRTLKTDLQEINRQIGNPGAVISQAQGSATISSQMSGIGAGLKQIFGSNPLSYVLPGLLIVTIFLKRAWIENYVLTMIIALLVIANTPLLFKMVLQFFKAGLGCFQVMVCLAIVMILAAILVPNFLRARASGMMTGCKSNLKNIGTALEMYSTDNLGEYPTRLMNLTPNYLRSIPTCPKADEVPGLKGHLVKIDPAFRKLFKEPLKVYEYDSTDEHCFYTIWCTSVGHPDYYPVGFPQYSSTFGLEDNQEQVAAESAAPEVSSFRVCFNNIKLIKTGIESYSKDHGGSPPSSIYDLVPLYMKEVPRCPSPRASLYGYSSKEGTFRIWCSGSAHANYREGVPGYYSKRGFYY